MPPRAYPKAETRSAVHLAGRLSVIEHRYGRTTYPRHAHAESAVTMILAGNLRERVGRVEETPRAFSVVVKPRDTEHANEFEAGVLTIQIRLPEQSAATAELWNDTLRHWRWSHGGTDVPRFLDLLRTTRAAAKGTVDSSRVEVAAYDAIAGLTLPRATTGEPPRWLQLVRESLDDAAAPASVAAMAETAGVHPVYLARRFRQWFGYSITEYLRRRRVQRVATPIATSATSLSSIAHEHGFADQPHLTRHFTRETGATPAAFRRLIRGEV